MTWLEKIHERRADTSGRTNIVIVPGNNGGTLADQTCSHFPTWLDEFVTSQNQSTVVWIFRHDLCIGSLASWFAYCEAGEHLLQNLTDMQKDDGLSDDDTLVLIGHKLGSFMLKKALLEAHRSSHHPHMDALLNTIETLVTLGDPELNADNQNEWISLISKCLPCKTLPKHLNCTQDAECLQYVAGCFEKFTLHSTLLQVSCAAESKRKHFMKFRAEDHRCIYSATMTVRLWTTTAEGVTFPPEEGDKKACAFYPKSTVYNRLLSIPGLGPQYSISGTPAQLPVLETQTGDGPSTFLPMGESVIDLTPNEQASPQATFLAMHPLPSIDTSRSMTVESTNGSDDVSLSGVGDETDSTIHGDQNINPRKGLHDIPATKASDEPENLPYYDLATDSPEATIVKEATHEDSVENVVQQNSPKILLVSEPPRIARRSPFLSKRVPTRDARFFGREELLITLEGVLIPGLMLHGSLLANLDSGAVIFLHGAPGVGKSAIALELTYRTQAAFDHVFWLHASSYLHLAQSFHEAAVSLGLVQDRRDHNHESSRQKLVAWLSTTSSKWLLVLDDADELQILSHFMPNRNRGSIILTSRQPLQKGLDEEDKCLHTFRVSPFDVEEATEFLHSLAPRAVDPANPAADLATLTTIAEDCRCLPLTLRRVGTILNHRSSSKDRQIMDVLEQHAGNVLASQPSSPLVYTTLSSASYALANVITFLDPHCIDDAILLGAQRYKDFPLSEFPMNDHDYFNAKNELIAHALLNAGADPSAFGLHRVTAGSLRAKLDPNNFRQGFHCASRLLEAKWPSRRKMKNIIHGNWPEFDTLHSHVHEISSIFVDHDRKPKDGNSNQELSNDSYIRILLHSTWYNAYRGNAEEDQVLIRLAHVLIARSQRPDPRLLQPEVSSTTLPARLIDVGLDDTQSPRVVDTAGQTGIYVALSYCWRSRGSLEKQLKTANMSRLRRSIEPSKTRRCVSDAIELTRSLGVRYIWIDSLCVVQDNQDECLNAMSRMSDIYRSAVLVIATVDTNDEAVDSCIDSSVLEQPFSIFLDWSRPTVAKSFSDCLFKPNNFSRHWAIPETFESKMSLLFSTYLTRWKQAARDSAVATRINESDTQCEGITDSDPKHDVEAIQLEVETTDTRFDEANREIEQGVHHVEAGNTFEALALFMKAREFVSAFQLLSPRSWKIHAVASANIASIYQMQHLPVIALDIAKGSMAVKTKLPNENCKSALELVQLHYVMGGIYNALENPDESLKSYRAASTDLGRLPGKEVSPESADWKGVVDLKLAEHQIRTKEYKEAHALLQQSLDHFQSQESLSAQAHLARTLHWQSLVYEAQGSKIMGNAIKAAARQTWIGVREVRGHAVFEGTTSLNTADFDEEVEFWYR